ncbi:MAG: CPBP family intramembrane metalloprotease [Acidimicrobiia bacterium]|nr:CPBP family intramembrane metalloprotease [Acidimicrobiia bacterium]
MEVERTRLALLVGVLVVWNVLSNLVVPSPAYVPANVAAALLMLFFSQRWGLGPRQLDMPGSDPARGVRFGVAGAAVAIAAVGVAVSWEWTRRFFEDATLLDLAGIGLAYQVLVRIPFGTAFFEEVAFRGVLFSQWQRTTTLRGATVATSLLFGLWHVLPTLGRLDLNPAGGYAVNGLATVGIVAGAVAVTAAAGFVFAWLRMRSGSLLAPIIAHALINSSAFSIGWLIAS